MYKPLKIVRGTVFQTLKGSLQTKHDTMNVITSSFRCFKPSKDLYKLFEIYFCKETLAKFQTLKGSLQTTD
ncbi:MAG: hypothetical protein MjAS7_2014 [Metallosphaera javensis (ex Sakai et al. 2022)]|nr:MAG: hypothetical protein MjAS7_2014 [Metallosphaera javensis (ex Sakai et al. 2022)]